MSATQVFLAILAVAWGAQVTAAFFQWRHLQLTIQRTARQHSDGFLGVGRARARLGFATIVMLVVGPDRKVRDLQVMSGMSVLARFRPRDEFHGLSLEALQARDLGKQMAMAVKEAIGQISKAG